MTGVATWGETLQARREAAGLSQEKLAALSGVARETIRAIEAGHEPRPRTRAVIDEALAAGPIVDRVTRLENQIADLKADLARVVELLQRDADTQGSPSRVRRPGPRGRQ